MFTGIEIICEKPLVLCGSENCVSVISRYQNGCAKCEVKQRTAYAHLGLGHVERKCKLIEFFIFIIIFHWGESKFATSSKIFYSVEIYTYNRMINILNTFKNGCSKHQKITSILASKIIYPYFVE